MTIPRLSILQKRSLNIYEKVHQRNENPLLETFANKVPDGVLKSLTEIKRYVKVLSNFYRKYAII